jgi:hypothetical protein
MKKYLDLALANETIKTTGIERKDKNGVVTVNEYAQVNERIKAFRMVYPQGSIVTQMLSNDNGVCVFKATVGTDDGVILGTGTAYEREDSSFINKTSYIENCETSAVGRALGMAGFGIDVSVASAEEVENAILNQEVTQEDADNYKLTFGKYNGKTLKEVEKVDSGYIDWMLNNTNDERIIKIIELATGRTIPSEEESRQRLELVSKINGLVIDTDTDYDDLYKHFKVKSLNQLTVLQLEECLKILEKKLAKKEGE